MFRVVERYVFHDHEELLDAIQLIAARHLHDLDHELASNNLHRLQSIRMLNAINLIILL